MIIEAVEVKENMLKLKYEKLKLQLYNIDKTAHLLTKTKSDQLKKQL